MEFPSHAEQPKSSPNEGFGPEHDALVTSLGNDLDRLGNRLMEAKAFREALVDATAWEIGPAAESVSEADGRVDVEQLVTGIIDGTLERGGIKKNASDDRVKDFISNQEFRSIVKHRLAEEIERRMAAAGNDAEKISRLERVLGQLGN